MKVVVVNGRGASGKTTFETLVQKIADSRGLKVEILSDARTRWKDIPYQACKASLELMEKEVDIVFVDCREPEEIERFVDDYNALTVLVQRGEVVLLGNHADDNVENYQYDVVIDNSRGLDELMQEATIFVETFVEDSN